MSNLYHKNPDISKADLCASFEKATTNVLIYNTQKALDIINKKNNIKINKIALAGGVSANSYIRKRFLKFGKKENLQIYYPELKICTDNAAMIASAGYYKFLDKEFATLDLNAIPNLKL